MKPLKPQSRIMGVDDGPYIRGSKLTPIIMTICRLDGYLEGVLASSITTDGEDSATVIADGLRKSRFGSQVRCIISDGGCLGGFNVLDMDLLNELTSLPVITASDEPPDQKSFESALSLSGHGSMRKLMTINTHSVIPVELKDGTCFVRYTGMTGDEAGSIIRRSVIRGRMPEPVRIAHLIATVVGRGAIGHDLR